MAIVERVRKDGTLSGYQARVKDKAGKWYPSKVRDQLADAKADEKAQLALKKKAALVLSNDARRITYSEFFEVWAIENRTNVGKGWKDSQDQMNRDHVAPLIGTLKMADVGIPQIGRVLNAARDKGLSAQMVKHLYSMLRKLFGDAVEYYRMLAENPVKPKFHRPKVKVQERAFLASSQVVDLLRAAQSHRYMGPPVWIMLLSGLRCEAALPLAWSAINWEQDQILISRAWKQREMRLENYPKGGDWVYVPMPSVLKEYLWERWLVSPRDPQAFICQSIRGEMLPYETFYQCLLRLCKSAGVPRVTPHELRHSCTELFVEQGASAEDIRRLLNQKSLSATSRYIHRTDGRLKGIAGNVGASIGGKLIAFPAREIKGGLPKRKEAGSAS